MRIPPIACLLALALAPPAAAQLFPQTDGDLTFEAVEPGNRPWLGADAYFFRDASGDEYYARSEFLSCRRTPDDPWRVVVRVGDSRRPDWFAGAVGDGAVFAVPFAAGGEWNVEVFRGDCTALWDALGDGPLRESAQFVLPRLGSWLRLVPAITASQNGRAFALGDTLCLGSAGQSLGVWCLDAAAQAFEVLVDGTTLPDFLTGASGALSALSLAIGRDLTVPPIELQWRLNSLEPLADGTLAAMVSAGAGNPDQVGLQWVVRVHGDRSVEVLLGPIARYKHVDDRLWNPRTDGPTVLGSGSELFYDPVWDALWLGPVGGWVHSTHRDGMSSRVDDYKTEEGSTGVGYRIVPLQGGGSGYLDLSERIITAQRSPAEPAPVDIFGPPRRGCYVPPVRAAGFSARGGDLVFEVPSSSPEGRDAYQRLVFDRGTVDLDADGLTWAEEVAHGTRDFDADSDGDGVLDGMEVAVGRDPSAPQPPAFAFPVALAPSPLLLALSGSLVELNRADQTLAQGSALVANGPHCLWLEVGVAGCVSADGRVLARWSPIARPNPVAVVAVDGTVAAAPDSDGIHRVDLATGARTLWVPRATLDGIYNRQAIDVLPERDLYLFPYDAETLITHPVGIRTASNEAYRAVRFDGTGQAEVLADMPALLADGRDGRSHEVSLEGSDCKGLTLEAPVNAGVGYHAATGRLTLGIRGNWESYLLGLHPSEPPLALQTSRALMQREVDDFAVWPMPGLVGAFPFAYSPLADGSYFTGWSAVGPHLEHAPRNPWSYQMLGSAVTGDFGQYAHGITQSWTSCGHAQLDWHGLEWVVYERRVRPGDTLLMGRGLHPYRRGIDGTMLWAIGPRGGANPLWARGSADIVGPTGMDVAADGTLCVADRGGQQLFELAPLDDGSMIPQTVVRRDQGLDVIDCHYDGEDLVWLTGDPPTVTVVNRRTGALVLQTAVASDIPGARPGALARNAEGDVEVVWLEPGTGGFRGGVITQAGTLVGYFNGDLSVPGGAPIELTGDNLYRAVERPDGYVVGLFSTAAAALRAETRAESEAIQRWGPFLVDDTGTVQPLTTLTDFFEGIFPTGEGPFVLAQVPGGDAVDPWTGEPDRRCWAPTPLAGPVGGADGGVTGDGGLADGGVRPAAGGADEGCGCDTTGQGGAALWFGLLLLAVRRRRRR